MSMSKQIISIICGNRDKCNYVCVSVAIPDNLLRIIPGELPVVDYPRCRSIPCMSVPSPCPWEAARPSPPPRPPCPWVPLPSPPAPVSAGGSRPRVPGWPALRLEAPGSLRSGCPPPAAARAVWAGGRVRGQEGPGPFVALGSPSQRGNGGGNIREQSLGKGRGTILWHAPLGPPPSWGSCQPAGPGLGELQVFGGSTPSLFS